VNAREWVEATEANAPVVHSDYPGPEFVWLHGAWVRKDELAQVIARKKNHQPLTPCKWRGIFRGGGE
jgi:hypothetical protein